MRGAVWPRRPMRGNAFMSPIAPRQRGGLTHLDGPVDGHDPRRVGVGVGPLPEDVAGRAYAHR